MSESRIDVSDFINLGCEATLAFEIAFSLLPRRGGTVYVPPGDYLIDTSKSIRVPDRCRLQLHPDAILRAAPTALPRAYVILIDGVTDASVIGGQIIGNRASFEPQPGTTSEWNHGVAVYNATRTDLRDLRISECVGDGISVGGRNTVTDLRIENVTCQNNRRQGLSLVNVSGATIVNSRFSGTNGTSPECGVDLEPEVNQVVEDVLFERCRFDGNAKYGVNLLVRLDNRGQPIGAIRRIRFVNPKIELNTSNGFYAAGASEVVVTGAEVRYNGRTGLVVGPRVATLSVDQCVFTRNQTKLADPNRTPFEQTGWTGRLDRDILISAAATGVTIGTNRYA